MWLYCTGFEKSRCHYVWSWKVSRWEYGLLPCWAGQGTTYMYTQCTYDACMYAHWKLTVCTCTWIMWCGWSYHVICQVTEQIEGEARRYYEHAITLRNTLKFLRHNPSLVGDGSGGSGLGVDLLRLESMASLDPGTLRRVLQKNYRYVWYAVTGITPAWVLITISTTSFHHGYGGQCSVCQCAVYQPAMPSRSCDNLVTMLP